ncbi:MULTISPECIES: DEAD/DEAH box helicase [Desertifilum]|uniref:DEAD/DEAH box helicase n=1 Tax=unclassified Desertifilum TaxID=2621682 RepID=UPI0018E9A0F0|nr:MULTISPECIES: DEAD/DEAH box helicase [Desertifilum]MDA0210811.1 DEAD/DEAH box helicase [Cyanobacteria bacterium FC1]
MLSKDTRSHLFELLRPKEAEILALILDAPDHRDVYQALKEVKIRRGSDRERALFDFFELNVPQPEVAIEVPSAELTTPQYSLFAHQRRAAQQVKKYLAQEPHRVLLHMPTGAGKTRTAMNIIADHLRSHEPTVVVWLAYSEELCEQAVAEFQRAWGYLGDRQLSVYRFWGTHEINIEEIRDGIIVAGLSKVYSAAKRSIRFINLLGVRSSLVIIDEAHQAIAETYQLILDSLVIPYENTSLLGLTATPGRTWADISADAKLAQFFARCKVTLDVPGYDNPIDYLVAEQYLAKAQYRSLLYDSGLTLTARDLAQIQTDLEIPQYILNRLAEDEQRNLRIILEIENLTYRHQRILVFATSVEHAKLLASVLRTRGFNADAITADTPSYQRERLISSFKDHTPEPKVLCNYGVLTTGFDAPRTSAALIARPTKSLVLYSQMVGRAIRGVKAGGNEIAEIVTVVDSNLPGFGSVAEAFSNWEDVWLNDS